MTISIDDFPVLKRAYNRSPRVARGLAQGLTLLHKFIEQDGARKGDFKFCKEDFNRAFEDAWNDEVSPLANRDDADERSLRYALLYPALHTAAGALKKLDKSKIDTEFTRAARALYEEIVTIQAVVEPFKTKIIVKEPKVDPVLAYQAPPASRAAEKAVYDLLKKITEDNVQRLADTLYGLSVRSVERFLTKQKEAHGRGEKRSWDDHGIINRNEPYGPIEYNDHWLRLAHVVFGPKNRHVGDVATKRLPGWKEKLRSQARADAEYQCLAFIYKNMTKCDSILEAKPSFHSVELLGLSGALLEGRIKVTFKDGSCFTAVTGIEDATSVLGRPYQRYPLRFHDVLLSSGERRSFVPEKDMNEVFVGKTG